jgi:chaperone BCS1
VRLPGGRPIQGRNYGGEVVFRSFFKSDLDLVREAIEKDVEEQTDYTFSPDAFDFDYIPETNVIAWSKGNWEHRKTRPSRSFQSVVLPKALQDAIEADLKGFTDSKARLQRLEIPWRRGFLLAGPPGTGKTSVSLALAGALKFSLATLSLTSIKSDDELKEAVSKLAPRTVLVIEDIDAYSVSHDRDHNNQTDGALSLSGLLNALDGFETPDGLVTIATTNHVDRLDPALKRSGRLDRTFVLDYIEAPELERLFTWFYEMEPLEPCPTYDAAEAALSPAEATELFKQHLDDPAAGWLAVRDRITTERRRWLTGSG